jgi:hypothetical protein
LVALSAEKVSNPSFDRDRPLAWHARLSGDVWNVWSGSASYETGFEGITVAKRDGITTDCVLRIFDFDVNRVLREHV